jgi:hypothetical protein
MNYENRSTASAALLAGLHGMAFVLRVGGITLGTVLGLVWYPRGRINRLDDRTFQLDDRPTGAVNRLEQSVERQPRTSRC